MFDIEKARDFIEEEVEIRDNAYQRLSRSCTSQSVYSIKNCIARYEEKKHRIQAIDDFLYTLGYNLVIEYGGHVRIEECKKREYSDDEIPF